MRTHPATPIKCGGAPQKIMYLADDYFRRSGARAQAHIHFYIGDPTIFKVEKYAKALMRVVARKELQPHFRHNLTEILQVADRIVVMFRGRTVHVTAAGDTNQETLIKYMTGYTNSAKAA